MNAEGSPTQGEPLFLAIGRLRRPHGFYGEMLMEVLTDFPERIHEGQIIFMGSNKDRMVINGLRPQGGSLLLSFEGVESDKQVGKYRNQILYIQAANLPKLPPGVFYHHELLNCDVVDENGKCLGKLVEIIETGTKDVYLVRNPEGGELLLPALDSVILDIDIEKHLMTVRPLEWE